MAEETIPESGEVAVETAPAPNTKTAPSPKALGDLTTELAPVDPNEPRKEVADGRAYEITYIVIAGDQGAIDETQERVKTLVESKEGAIDNVRVSEVRRLAYPIEKRFEGVYIVINARFSKDLTTELDRLFKLDERVLRHIILRDAPSV